jgi:hypothetical protein
MKTKTEVIEWTSEKVRVAYSIFDDTPEVPEDDPTYPVNKGTIWGTTVELDSAAFNTPHGDLSPLVAAATAKLDAEKQAKEALAQEIRTQGGLPAPAPVVHLNVEHQSVSDDDGTVKHGYAASVSFSGPPGLEASDLEIRDCTGDYATINGNEAFSDEGTATLREERFQEHMLAGWFMELWDKKNSKSLHRWTMPGGTYAATVFG